MASVTISSEMYLDLILNKRKKLQEAYVNYFEDNGIDFFHDSVFRMLG